MIIEAAAIAAAAWGLHAWSHHAILNGLRAPRLTHGRAPDNPDVPRQAWREVVIPGANSRQLFGWMVRPASGSGRPDPAVLVMHGWGSNASMMWPVVRPLHEAGFAVLLIDARCHGLSDNEAFSSMPRFAEDIAAGLGWLRGQTEVAAHRVALLGHSVGAAAAMLHASRHHDVSAVVSLSAFAHPREVMLHLMAEHRVPYPLIGWYVLHHVQRVIGARFDDIAPLTTLRGLQCPVLLVHGVADSTVPFSDAQRLQSVSSWARLLPVNGDHDLRDTLALHGGALVEFLRQADAQARLREDGGNDDHTLPWRSAA